MDNTTIIEQIFQNTKLNNNELFISFDGNFMIVTIKDSIFNIERKFNIPQNNNEINTISCKISLIQKEVWLGKKYNEING